MPGHGPDLSGGLDPSRDRVLAERPADPEMRESVNVWAWDADGIVGFPRVGIEAVAERWDTPDVQLSVTFADGRVLHTFEPHPAHGPADADGRPRIRGAGPLVFECVEPLRHWTMRYDGEATLTTVEDEIAGRAGPRTRVRLAAELDLHAAAPPWDTGTLRPESAAVMGAEEGAFIGGPRFEQLCRTRGRLTLDGETHPLDGGALRVHRHGVRRLHVGGLPFWGHAWQSALFPSGRGFGFLVFPPRPDRRPTFNEGYLYDGTGPLRAARVREAPWLARTQARGEPVRAVLETAAGPVTITGETLASTFLAIPNGTDEPPILQQAIVRYRCNGEIALGMMERSMPPGRVRRTAP